jgi:hypothetical protein
MKITKSQLKQIIREELEGLELTEQQIEEILPRALKKWGARAALAGTLAGVGAPATAHAGDSFDDWRTTPSSQQAEESGKVKVTDANGDTWNVDTESGFGTLCSETECRAKTFTAQELAQLTGGSQAVKEGRMSKAQLTEIIKEELSGYLSNIYKWCPAGTKCAPEKKKTKWWKGR